MQVIYHVSIQRAVEELEKTALEKFVSNETSSNCLCRCSDG